jgi:hypothetical protein
VKLQSPLTYCHVCLASIAYSADGSAVYCRCGVKARALIYPAIFRLRAGSAGEAIQTEGESACFAHEDKRAVAACDSCGRFVCALCRIEWGSRVLCPVCVNAAEKRTDLLTRSRTLYDSIALTIALSSVPLFTVSLITAPIAVYLSIRALRAPRSLVPRTMARAWAALTVSLLELGGWGWLLVYVVMIARR